jgi:hypothetical protein
MQLWEDYYPSLENDMMITEMRAESWLRFEGQLNNRSCNTLIIKKTGLLTKIILKDF